MEQYKFASLFINQFYPRPGTPAARMKRVPTQEVKTRSRELSKLFQSYLPYEHKLGETQLVLATQVSHDQEYYVAHNKYYDQVQSIYTVHCLLPLKEATATEASTGTVELLNKDTFRTSRFVLCREAVLFQR